jgi:ABC-type Fe3+-siderophore transport system permease subunit
MISIAVTVALAILGTAHEAYICFAIAGAWAVVSMLYVLVRSRRTGRAILAAPRQVA